MRGFTRVRALLLVCLVGAQAAVADEPGPPRIGGDIRIRGEAFDNALDMDDRADDAYQFTRMRYRLWIEGTPRPELRLFFRLGGEYRWGQQASSGGNPPGPASIRDPESRVALDNGWVEIAWPPRSGVTWRLGRQDLMYGEGFLIFDGTPADGSSSAYFDAIRARWKRGGWTVDAFTAKLLDRGFASTGRDEDLHGLYAVRTLPASWTAEGYVLHRFQRQAKVFQAGTPWEITSPRQETTAIGGRISHLPETGLQLALEGANQFGSYMGPHDEPEHSPDDRRRAFGAHARAGWVGPLPDRVAIEAGGVLLSGDNRTDELYQGWDPFYSEWPKWSELLIYSFYDGTTRVFAEHDYQIAGAWTNLLLGWVEVRGEPWTGACSSLRTSSLRRSWPTWSHGKGGFLVAARLEQRVPAGATLQLLGEHSWAGRHFAPQRDVDINSGADPAWYARFQLTAGF